MVIVIVGSSRTRSITFIFIFACLLNTQQLDESVRCDFYRKNIKREENMSKKNKSNGLTAFLASSKGQLFFHVTYSVGASIVILGALAKIIHLPMGNVMLIIGMLVEAFVFLLSAFDVEQVDYVEKSDSAVDSYAPETNTYVRGNGGQNIGETQKREGAKGAPNYGVGGSVSGSLNIGGNLNISEEYLDEIAQTTQKMASFSKVMASLNDMSEKILEGCNQINNGAGEFGDLSNNMSKLNNNVAKINDLYETQLSSIENQMSTLSYIGQSLERIKGLYSNTVIDSDMFRIENQRMAQQIQELNRIYARLLQAMNVGTQMQGNYNQPYQQPQQPYQPQPYYGQNPENKNL